MESLKLKLARRLALLLVTSAGLTITFTSSAEDLSWSTEEQLDTRHERWMAWVPDHVRLSQLSIPRTHDTMARFSYDAITLNWVRTQTLPLMRQLQAGVRALDIRGRHYYDRFAIHHGDYFQHAFFDDVLRDCNLFLEVNPTETIFIWLGSRGFLL